ncbi:DNA damage-inducible protein D [Idiomarina aminovorans]|uniref:DNA damage-inducible protein D n=1 Tax=Idiomarina aminovorans TaxID=2914829 RepID=UPI0020041588|nr:DNA damage-inducible protein D [Idiomarina sp. ATCH4]MCK7460031.1 DNA damage-inducible protein D [Idiomarina sp. ATCH4]
MEQQQVQTLTTTFEGHAQQTETGVEFWLARDLQHLLGYGKWDNFQSVISKAKTACEVSGHDIADHFADVGKMVELGSGSQRQIDDIMLTRYACYLIAQNGDSRKQEIAFAQTYFAMQTRKAELIEQRLLETERVQARQKLSATEKELSSVIYEQTGGNHNFALIRSKGDTALFGRNTKSMKAQWQVPANRPLADFAPTIILKAKDFAAEITIHNARTNNMNQESEISGEHVTNNTAVRKTLLDRGIRPESLPPAEDVKKVERRLTSSEKRSVKNPDKLDFEGDGNE